MLRRIQPEKVEIGMYVQGFAGGWLAHPFWRGRFLVESEVDLRKLRDSDVEVMIDITKGIDIPPPPATEAIAASEPRRRSGLLAQPQRSLNPLAHRASVPPPIRITAPAAFGRADKGRATAVVQRSNKVVKALFQDFRSGRAISTPDVLAVVDDIANTLEQNVAAFVNVTRLKAKDDYTYTHSIAVCALMISLSRETGAGADLVREMGTAGLLHDIGKVSVDEAILKKTGALTEAETMEVRRHPEIGHKLLEAESDLPPVVRDVCLHHHERLDGTGYPFGLAGDAVSRAARIAAICDTYDALTSDRAYRPGMSPTEAMVRMEAAEGALDPDLLFRFMRSIGVFPPGKLVRLRSNRLAVVLPSTQQDRRPVVRIFYSTVDTCLTPYEDAVLSDSLNSEQAMSPESADQWFGLDWPAMYKAILAGRPIELSFDPMTFRQK